MKVYGSTSSRSWSSFRVHYRSFGVYFLLIFGLFWFVRGLFGVCFSEGPKISHKTKKIDDTLILRFHLSIVVALNSVKTDVQTKKA